MLQTIVKNLVFSILLITFFGSLLNVAAQDSDKKQTEQMQGQIRQLEKQLQEMREEMAKLKESLPEKKDVASTDKNTAKTEVSSFGMASVSENKSTESQSKTQENAEHSGSTTFSPHSHFSRGHRRLYQCGKIHLNECFDASGR